MKVSTLPIKHCARFTLPSYIPEEYANAYMIDKMDKVIYTNQIHHNYHMKELPSIMKRQPRPTHQRRAKRSYVNRRKHRIMAEEFCNHLFWAYGKYIPLTEIKKRKDTI